MRTFRQRQRSRFGFDARSDINREEKRFLGWRATLTERRKPMTILYATEIVYPVRAKRGEIRGPGGKLVKFTTGTAPTIEDARREVECLHLASLAIFGDNYGQRVATRYYSRDAFKTDPLNAKPLMIDSYFPDGRR